MAEKLEHNAVESVTKMCERDYYAHLSGLHIRQRAELVTLLISQVGLVIPRNGNPVPFFVI